MDLFGAPVSISHLFCFWRTASVMSNIAGRGWSRLSLLQDRYVYMGTWKLHHAKCSNQLSSTGSFCLFNMLVAWSLGNTFSIMVHISRGKNVLNPDRWRYWQIRHTPMLQKHMGFQNIHLGSSFGNVGVASFVYASNNQTFSTDLTRWSTRQIRAD